MLRYPCLVGGFRGALGDMVGMTNQEKRENFDKALSQEKKKLSEAVKESIIKRAEDGQLDAVEWLQKNGLIEWPMH